MVLKRAPFNRNHKAYWICTCDCGASVTVCGGNLRNGSIKSCGCLKAEHARILRLVHGDKRTKSGKIASEWRAWRSMIERCENAANASFSRYGGRGITICAEWRDDYRSFLKYLGRKPTPKHSLDRIDNDGNYEPGNVRWATAKEQANNRSNSR
jgi:hypothetical protein